MMFLQLLINGISMGFIYALIGLGFVLIYSVTNNFNFAQGDMVTIGGFMVVATFASNFNLPLWVTIIIMFVGMAFFGMAYQYLCYYPVRKSIRQAFMIVSVGVGIIIRNLSLLFWGPQPRSGPRIISKVFINIGNVSVNSQHISVAIVSILILIVLSLIYKKTKIGAMMRATAQDEKTAQLMGIKVHRMRTLAFMISSIIAGIAGFLVTPMVYLSPQMGRMLFVKAFVGLIIGGLGSIVGAVVGGISIGVLEMLISAYISSTYKEVILFILLILFLYFIPNGLFGARTQQKKV